MTTETTTTETTQPQPLTTEDISYLRRADDVVASHYEGRNVLRAIKRARWTDRFDSDKTVEIVVAGNGTDGYHAGTVNFPWHTLRKGDIVSLVWRPDAGTNEYARRAGLHVDELHIDVQRGSRSARYMVETQVTPDNSARMCQTDRLHKV